MERKCLLICGILPMQWRYQQLRTNANPGCNIASQNLSELPPGEIINLLGLPCPATIYTFGILLLSERKCPVVILIISFIWSVIGFTAAFNFGIVEDTGLLVSALLTLAMLFIKDRENKQVPGRA